MGQIRNIFFISTIILTVASCATVKKEETDARDLSYLYNPLRNPIHPRYQIYNISEDLSELTIKFFTNDLYFTEANPEGVPKAELLIIYRLYDMSQGRIAVDTGFYNINIRKEQGNRQYTYKIPMRASAGSKYEAELVIRDLIRNNRIQTHLPFDKTSDLSSNNFKVRGHFNKIELFNPVLRSNEFVNLLYRYDTDSLFVMYFEPDDASPIPPSMLMPARSIDTEPEATVPLAYSDTLALMFPNRGIYLCTTDTNRLEGYSFFNFGDEFPGMTKAETMIDPLIYLSNEDHIRQMKNSERLKAELDNFWLNITGNVERSRELIRIYYNRVLYANYFFTSHKEGWRTDRGMIYIIYGPPDKVYKSPGEERWAYLKKQVRKGWGIRYKIDDEYLYFSFSNRENPFTTNDYILRRSESVTSYWDEAIRSWRSGIVFRLDNPSGI
ncbi:MAG TPA: GWxTD domain-containing protein [Bacteroidetes bacterium]|nr:GWxTD domain-containing protein [Bacteroidota bacterium]